MSCIKSKIETLKGLWVVKCHTFPLTMSDPYQGSAAKPLSLPAAVQKELKTAFNIDIGKLRFVNGSNPGSWELFCIHRWANLHLLMANLCRPPSDLCSAIFSFMGILTFQFERWWWLWMVLWQLMQIWIQIPIVDRRINQGKEVSDGQGWGPGCQGPGQSS